MKDNMNIGIFDSGIGGVTVLKEILRLMPNENYIYYSDSKNNPYGDKEQFELYDICKQIVEYLITLNCKVIVIACNTASAKCAKNLREQYKDTIFIAIEPAYKMVYDTCNASTLIMATKATVESKKFNILYNKYNNHKTYILACKGLAEKIERDDKEELEIYLENLLNKYKGKVENVVLGCTHYPLIKKQIKKQLGTVKFFEGSYRLALHLKDILQNNHLLINDNKKGKIQFIDSSNSKNKEKRFYNILNSQEENE